MDKKNIDNETYSKLLLRVKFLKKKYSFCLEHLQEEEIANDVALSWMRGHGQHQTIEQAVIDIIRRDHGRIRIDGNNPRGNFNKKTEFDDNKIQPRRCNGILEECREIIDTNSGKFSVIDRAILKLLTKWGMDEIEIGDIFGVSGSRISQRITGIQKRLHAFTQKEKYFDSGSTEQALEGLLSEEKNARTIMEFIETEAMETSSW